MKVQAECVCLDESYSGRNKFNADFSIGVKTAKKIIYTNSKLIYIQTKDGYSERSEIRLRQCRGLTDSLEISNFIRSLFFFKGHQRFNFSSRWNCRRKICCGKLNFNKKQLFLLFQLFSEFEVDQFTSNCPTETH